MLTVRAAREAGASPTSAWTARLRELHAKDALAKCREVPARRVARHVWSCRRADAEQIRAHYTGFPWTIAELPDVLAWRR